MTHKRKSNPQLSAGGCRFSCERPWHGIPVGMDIELTDRVLAVLGVKRPTTPDLEALTAIYGAWCQRIPFDSIIRRAWRHSIAMGELPQDAPMPDNTPEQFFDGWLKYGAGGACWAANGALSELLWSLGFQVQRGLGVIMGSMLSNDSPEPNHGTVSVLIDGSRYMVDASLLFQEPLLLADGANVDHPAWGVTAQWFRAHYQVIYRPLVGRGQRVPLRILQWGVSAEVFVEMNEKTRPWSPYIYELTFRKNVGDEVRGLAHGHQITISANGFEVGPRLDGELRVAYLSGLGADSSILGGLPPDATRTPRNILASR